jgi:LPXTG-motif cell wall-anchored protein
MPYIHENVLIARPAASNLSGWFDKFVSAVNKVSGSVDKVSDAAKSVTAKKDEAPPSPPPSSGPSTTTLILGGVAVVGIVGLLAFKRKKK